MRSRGMLAAGAIALLALLASGCVMPDQMAQLQKDVADVRQQLRRVQQDQDETIRKLDDMETRAANDESRVTRADFADLKVQVDQVHGDVAVVDERMNSLGQRIDRLSQQLTATRNTGRQNYTQQEPAPVPAGGAAPGGSETASTPTSGSAMPDPQLLYNTAYADYSKGNYALAVSGFQEYQEKFPDSATADNALYWVGECHFSQGSFPEAIDAFDTLLEDYPKSDKAAGANLKKALAYLEQSKIGQAIIQLRYVVSNYPGSDEAKIAGDRLTSLGAPL